MHCHFLSEIYYVFKGNSMLYCQVISNVLCQSSLTWLIVTFNFEFKVTRKISFIFETQLLFMKNSKHKIAARTSTSINFS